MNLKALAFLGVTCLSLAACTVNPATGRNQLNALSREQEVQMGTQATPELTQEYGGAVPDAECQAYIAEVGRRLAAATEGQNPSLPWEFTLLNSGVINAFSLPGGKVFISRALVEQMDDEAELAGVLGHEIGHVTARHINDQVTRETLAGTAAEIAASIAGESENAAIREVSPMVINLAGQSILLRYSRGQETEADALGVRYMVKNRYDPGAQIDVMKILQREMGQARDLEFFSTHPYPETRIKQLQSLIKDQYQAAVNSPESVRKREEFRTRCLDRLKKLPPPPKSGPAPPAASPKGVAPNQKRPARSGR